MPDDLIPDPIIADILRQLELYEFAAKARRRNITREINRQRKESKAKIQARHDEIAAEAAARAETLSLKGSIDRINAGFWAAFEKRQPILAGKLRQGAASVASGAVAPAGVESRVNREAVSCP